jgi:site-specific recombinase XerD
VSHVRTEIPAEADLIRTYLLRFDRENTRRSYRNDLASFFQSDLVTLDDARGVTFVDVNRYIERLESDGYASSTLRRRVASLRGFFAWLIALGAVDTNPADRHLIRRISRSGGQDRAITVLTKEQARDLVDAVDLSTASGVRDRALILTLLHCVLRRSEAAAMDAHHIRTIGRYWVLDIPSAKGGSDQYVRMPDHVAESINNHLSYYGITSGPVWRSVSNNSRGRRLSGSSIYDIVNNSAKMAGIGPVVGAHTLRHTGCTLAIESGATVQQVQTHARHKNLETTMTYVHQRNKLADSAADFISLDED